MGIDNIICHKLKVQPLMWLCRELSWHNTPKQALLFLEGLILIDSLPGGDEVISRTYQNGVNPVWQ